MLTSDLVKVNYQGICSIHPIKNTAAEKVFDSITRIKQTDLYTNRNFKVMYLLFIYYNEKVFKCFKPSSIDTGYMNLNHNRLGS